MIEYLYNYLRDRPLEKQRQALEQIQKWAEEHDLGVDISEFLNSLQSLLGI